MMNATLLRLRRWAGEPFKRFLILGALIFVMHAMLGSHEGGARRIEVSAADVERLRASAVKQWGHEPGPEQTRELIEASVREEVLYREALAEGLDRDDVIVRRRLAQKMEFVAQEDVRSPDEAAMRAYFDTHAARYSRPAVVDLQHVTFHREGRADARGDAVRALAHLRAGRPITGDASMLSAVLDRQDEATLARDFGSDFAHQAMTTAMDEWTGPIDSPLGYQLIRVSHRMPAGAADFEEARERVRADMLNERVTGAREAAYARARARYSVRIDTPEWRMSAIDNGAPRP
jgi:peptidyl-prolyl cis-trans isomerase C